MSLAQARVEVVVAVHMDITSPSVGRPVFDILDAPLHYLKATPTCSCLHLNQRHLS